MDSLNRDHNLKDVRWLKELWRRSPKMSIRKERVHDGVIRALEPHGAGTTFSLHKLRNSRDLFHIRSPLAACLCHDHERIDTQPPESSNDGTT